MTPIRFTATILLGIVAWLGAVGAAVGQRPTPTPTPLPTQPTDIPWPTERWSEAEPDTLVDRARLEAALEFAFTDSSLRGTRSVVVVHRGRIVAERYATGFNRESRFISHSVAKFLVGTLVGILVREGRLDVKAPANVPEWRDQPHDPRARITLENLLHMSSGLQWDESYVNMLSDLPLAMAGTGYRDEASFVASYPLAHEPGTFYYYSSGTTQVVSGIIRRTVGDDRASYLRFMWNELFEPLGMRSAVPEFDAAGTFIGSSWFWATSRDFARLGLLHLRDGRWDSRRILPEGWVDYARTPGPAANNRGGYGIHSYPWWPDSDAFGHAGYLGQALVIVPSRDLVLVRNANILHDGYSEVMRDNLWEVVEAFPRNDEG